MHTIELLINEAKDLLRLLNRHDDTTTGNLFKKYMHTFRELGAEHAADLTPTADQSYEIKLRQFIKDLETAVY